MNAADDHFSAGELPEAERFILFRIDNRRFGIDLDSAERTVHAVEVTPLAGAPDAILGIINVHGTIVPVFNLRRRFGINEREVDITDQFLLARRGERTVALVADAVLGIAEFVPAEGEARNSGTITGMVELEDGAAEIHDVMTLLSADDDQMLEMALREHSVNKPESKRG